MQGAFALWFCGSNPVVTWSDETCGGDSGLQDQLKGVQQFHGNSPGRWIWIDVALRTADLGGDSSAVRDCLRSLQHVQAADYAFAAILSHWSVVTWDSCFGGSRFGPVMKPLLQSWQMDRSLLRIETFHCDPVSIWCGHLQCNIEAQYIFEATGEQSSSRISSQTIAKVTRARGFHNQLWGFGAWYWAILVYTTKFFNIVTVKIHQNTMDIYWIYWGVVDTGGCWCFMGNPTDIVPFFSISITRWMMEIPKQHPASSRFRETFGQCELESKAEFGFLSQ